MEKTIELNELNNPVQEIMLGLMGYKAIPEVEKMKGGLKEWYEDHAFSVGTDMKCIEKLYKEWRIISEFFLIDNVIHMIKVPSPFRRSNPHDTERYVLEMSLMKWAAQDDTIKEGHVHNLWWGWSGVIAGIRNYPTTPIEIFDYELKSLAEVELHMEKKFGGLNSAFASGIEGLPECNRIETWFDAKKRVHNRCEYYCSTAGKCMQKRSRK